MAGAEPTGEILARALQYPYAAPAGSYIWTPAGERRWPPAGADLEGRRPLLAYGSNAAPAALDRKLGGRPPGEGSPATRQLPVQRAQLAGSDVVYSAHVSPYGAVPATLWRSEGTVASVFLAWVTDEQEALIAATEPNYVKQRLGGAVRDDAGAEVGEVDAFVSRHGCLALDGEAVALAAVEARGRVLPALDQPQVLERVRQLVAPECEDLEELVVSSLEPGRAAARTEALHATALH